MVEAPKHHENHENHKHHEHHKNHENHENNKHHKKPSSAEHIHEKTTESTKNPDMKKLLKGSVYTPELKGDAYQHSTKLKAILHKESNETLPEPKKVTRKEILKTFDSQIEKKLQTGVKKIDFNQIVKNNLNGRKDTPENREKVKEGLREQFLQGEIKKLNSVKTFKTKDGKEFTETIKQHILNKNPEIAKALNNNVKDVQLQNELLAIYGTNGLKGYTNLFTDKKIQSIEDFEKFRKEEIIKRGIEAGKWKVDENGNLVERTEEEKKEAEKNMKEAMKDPKVAKQMAKRMSGNKGISKSEARNVQAEKLDLTGDARERSLNLIKHFEGFVSNSYWDYKQYTRGYGTKAPGAGAKISKEAATEQLNRQVESKYNLKTELTKRGLSDVYDKLGPNQVAALTSFIYNLGPGKLTNFKPLLLEYSKDVSIEDKKKTAEKIGAQLEKYNKAGGRILEGLVRRRKTEAKIFKEGIEDKKDNANNEKSTSSTKKT